MKKDLYYKFLIKGIFVNIILILLSINLGCGDETSGDKTNGDGSEETSEEINFVEGEELYSWIMEYEDMIVIDVRTNEEYNAFHIQDAINIDLDTLIDEQGNILNDGKALTDKVLDKSVKIVSYCSGEGSGPVEGETFAKSAVKLGYRNVYAYKGGTNDWHEKGYYFVIEYEGVIANHYPLKAGEFIVDILSIESYNNAHIPGAINIPLELFVDEKGNLVDNGDAFTSKVSPKDAYVIIYCERFSCNKSLQASLAAESLGYTNILRYQGGLDEWREKGQKTEP